MVFLWYACLCVPNLLLWVHPESQAALSNVAPQRLLLIEDVTAGSFKSRS